MPKQKRQHLKRRKDGRYCCVFNGKQFMGSTEEEALAKREEYKQLLQSAEYSSINPTVAAYAIEWIKREKASVSEQTYREAAILLEKLVRAIGDKYPRDVKPSDVKAIYVSQFRGLSSSYIRSASQLYRALFDAFVEDGLCRTNPARQKSSRPTAGTTGGNRSITPQEREWIETLCTDHRAHPAVMAMLYAGIRPQEAKAMDIDRDIDTKNDIVTVRESVHLKGHNQYDRTEKLKTDFSRREIPLFPPLKAAINGKHGPLIPSASGKKVSVQAWRSVWESYVTDMETAINGMHKRWYRRTKAHKAILAEAEKLRKEGRKEEAEQKEKCIPEWIHFTVKPYDLRHSFATMCRDADPPVELNTCVHWMGHKDAKMILRIYDEYTATRSQKEAERLKKTLFHMQNDMQSEGEDSETIEISTDAEQ